MAITVGGVTIPIMYPVEGNEGFMDQFFGMLDGQAVAVGATLTVPTGKIFGVYQLDTLAGSVATLPAATGSTMRALFYVKTLATSVSHKIITSPLTDVFVGLIMGARTDSGNAVLGFAAASTDNTITLNRTTTGSVNKGEWVEVLDAASGIWQVRGMLSATGAAFATPFSHT